MISLFNTNSVESLNLLLQRMLRLQQAIAEGKISQQQLQDIAALSTVELEVSSQALLDNTLDPNIEIKSLRTLFDILNDKQQHSIVDSQSLEDALKQFEEEHGEYLSLESLAVANEQTLSLHLNDFATFNNVFIQYMTSTKHAGEALDEYILDIDLRAAKSTWLAWKNTRPTHLVFNANQAEQPGLLEKFLAGTLKQDEWLTDTDIERALKIFGLNDSGVHIVPFKADDIGLALHFEREKHVLDDPELPYTIPLIVNLGEDNHSRINSRGKHWTRILVSVDPRSSPATISAAYKDELYLPEASKRKIETTLINALKYRGQISSYSLAKNAKIFAAFPDCEQALITIDGSDVQRDGFTCGHRALQGLISDLVANDSLPINNHLQQFIDCANATQLRDFIYRTLISQQPVSRQQHDTIIAPLSNQALEGVFYESPRGNHFIKPNLIDGQLLAFSRIKATTKSANKLDLKQLEVLANTEKLIAEIRDIESVRQLENNPDASINIDINQFMTNAQIKALGNDDAAIKAIFKSLQSNTALKDKNIIITGTDALSPDLLTTLKNEIDTLKTGNIISNEPGLSDYVKAINVRNSLLLETIQDESETDPWSQLFKSMLFDLPITPSGDQFVFGGSLKQHPEIKDIGTIELTKFLQYIANNENLFTPNNFSYHNFILTSTDLSFLDVLKTHLQSDSPYSAFKEFTISINDFSQVNLTEFNNEIKELLPLLQKNGIERLEINSHLLPALSIKQVDELIDFVKQNQITTILSISAPDTAGNNKDLLAKLRELENTIIRNRRTLPTLAQNAAPTAKAQHITLGKIGRAILQLDDIGTLDTEVQVQQQQQVQQQIQTAIDDNELPEEDELIEESFLAYSGKEELLDKASFIAKMNDFVLNRHPHLTAEQCWDLISGKNADFFKYGIHKMTVSAAKQLVENLKDVQFGLHPDNLPKGFYLQQENNHIVIAYDPVNPPINPNESPLTVSFSKPQAANNWAGNALQFINLKQAEQLYAQIFGKMKSPKPNLDNCISDFFFMKRHVDLRITPAHRRLILDKFIEGMAGEDANKLKQQLTELFGDTLTNENLAALSEILYEQGAKGLSEFLNPLQQLKQVKGDDFFRSFKTCFIDPSKNLNELTDEKSHQAMQKLLALSPAQSTWWVSLTEQHTSHKQYYPKKETQQEDEFQLIEENQSGQRFANLAELTDGFLHFCGQLSEINSSLKVPGFCPLSDVADMRVGLDRLLLILANAHDINEQFYESLDSLQLDSLGPFYASRYEGYKLVTPQMKLSLGALSAIKDELKGAEKGLCFRFNKQEIGGNFSSVDDNDEKFNDKKLAYFLRYIATFNHRAIKSLYEKAFDKIIEITAKNKRDYLKAGMIDSALIIVAVFGTGKRGKNFTEQDIAHLINFINRADMLEDNDKNKQNLITLDILNSWRSMRNFAIRPTISEILSISELALISCEDPKNMIRNIKNLLSSYSENAESYIETLLTLTKNPKGLNIDSLQSALLVIEDLVQVTEEIKPLFDFPVALRATATKLLAVCDGTGVDEDSCGEKVKLLYEQIQACFDKHGGQTTSDLLELLSNIDVVNSAKLPTLDQLVTLIKKIQQENTLTYNQLGNLVKSEPPTTDYIIATNKVTAASVQPAGNLQTIITKHMDEILEDFKSYKNQIDGQMGKGFYDSLKGPSGASFLLKSLKHIANITPFIRNRIEGKVKEVMIKVYEDTIAQGIANIGAKGQQELLITIFTKQLTHAVKGEIDFIEFTNIFANELSSLEQSLVNLQRINKKWPVNFPGILTKISASPAIGEYPLTLLDKITNAFVTNFNENHDFPLATFSQFFSYDELNQETKNCLSVIIDTIFDKDELETSPLSAIEKQRLCELAIKYGKTKPASVNSYLEDLIKLQQSQPELFTTKLNLMLASSSPDLDEALHNVNEAVIKISKLNQPELTAIVFNFFTEEHAREFIPFVNNLNEINEENLFNVINIVLRAAQKQRQQLQDQNHQQKPSDEEINELHNSLRLALGSLKNLAPELLQQLSALYETPRYPDLLSLNESLTDLDATALQALEAQYDRDPFGKRADPEVLKEQFDTSRVTALLNGLRDLNTNRPLLLSQRQALQKQFLYINAIGKDKPIHTKPNDLAHSKLKAIKDMSHAEIRDLTAYYRDLIQNPGISPERRTKAKLEYIAILRDVMYRGTGKFPRPTQIFYLLNAMQRGGDFIAQIPTGQGKSITTALAAAMMNIEGKTVDVCTSNLFLAAEGLEENQKFFDYLGIHTKLIDVQSATPDDYQKGGIYYSSMSDIALYRSKMELRGKVFPDDCVLIADEGDFLTLDDNTRYRFAVSLDPITDPYKSPYVWVYEALVEFADAQKNPQVDEVFIAQAKQWLKNSAKNKLEKTLLQNLEATPDVYTKRLETWLIAAGKTGKLINQEETRFRVVQLKHKKSVEVSKACILANGRPNIEAEFSNTIQQFLHVRSRAKYRDKIKQGTIPDFLVEPEKTYITTLNSKILLNRYQRRLGMSATVGSPNEIKEQHAKYGFSFVDIPPFHVPNRDDLSPILTAAKHLNNPVKEEQDLLQKIAKEVLNHIGSQAQGKCGPMLILCENKIKGEKIRQVIDNEMNKNPHRYKEKFSDIKEYYSSDKPTAKERHVEEETVKKNAGLEGMITISTVFDRGTDITPTHKNGLYTMQTYVDTEPYSAEDLERAKRQKIGRSARQDQYGKTRLIVRRSEFADAYKGADQQKLLKKIPQTVEGLDKAIADLNNVRNQTRVRDRELRECFDDVKEMVYQQFFKFIELVNNSDDKTPKNAVRDQLMKQWNLLLQETDEYWEELQHNSKFQENPQHSLEEIAKFTCKKWQELSQKDGLLEKSISNWATRHKLPIQLPADTALSEQEVITKIQARHADIRRHYIKQSQLSDLEEMSEDAVYCDFAARDSAELQLANRANLDNLKLKTVRENLASHIHNLSTPAHLKKLQGKFDFKEADPEVLKVQKIMGSLLYLRYKAYCDGNPIAYAKLCQQCRKLTQTIMWSGNVDLQGAISNALHEHFKILTTHRGEHENKKHQYLPLLIARFQHDMPNETAAWKKANFNSWWTGEQSSIVKQLTSYRDKWWTRAWVSDDRKAITTTFLQSLESSSSDPKQILAAITTAREQILQDDIRNNKRKMDNGLNGRLNQYLSDIQTRVIAALDSEAVDKLVVYEFQDIKNVLTVFSKRITYSKWISSLESIEPGRLLNDDGSVNLKEVQRQYQTLSQVFTRIEALATGTAADKSPDIQTLHTYCQQKQTQLVNFFAQCNKLSTINQQRSVQVFRAASYAATSVLNKSKTQVSRVVDIENVSEITYGDDKVAMQTGAIAEIKNQPFFQQINHPKIYKELLYTIERLIVEQHKGDTDVQFTKITLDTNSYFHGGFKLTIDLKVDGVATDINYHFNMKKQSVYCDNHALADLDHKVGNDKQHLVESPTIERQVRQNVPEDVPLSTIDPAVQKINELRIDAEKLTNNTNNLSGKHASTEFKSLIKEVKGEETEIAPSTSTDIKSS